MEYTLNKKTKFYLELLKLEELSDLQRDGIYINHGEDSEMTFSKWKNYLIHQIG